VNKKVMELNGQIAIFIQWDLDHHYPVVFIDGTPLSYHLAKHLELNVPKDCDIWCGNGTIKIEMEDNFGG